MQNDVQQANAEAACGLCRVATVEAAQRIAPQKRSLLCPLSERGCRHPLLFAVLDLLVLLDQAKSTRNSVRRKTSDRFFGKYPAPSIRRFPARSRVTTFLLHNTVYEFAARTYYPRRISKSRSDAPLILHYGIALSVIITNYNRLHPDEPFIRWI